MTQKRTSLKESLSSAAQNDIRSQKPEVTPKEKRDRVLIGAMFDPAVRRQLKILEAENDKNLNTLLSEAINDLFSKYNKSRIA